MIIESKSLTNTQRNMLFFFGCIPTRIIYAIILNSSYAIKYHLLWLNLFIGIGFIYKWYTWKGEKGAFGGVLWWNNMRFIHGIIHLIAFFNPRVLYLDIIIGIFAKIQNIYSS